MLSSLSRRYLSFFWLHPSLGCWNLWTEAFQAWPCAITEIVSIRHKILMNDWALNNLGPNKPTSYGPFYGLFSAILVLINQTNEEHTVFEAGNCNPRVRLTSKSFHFEYFHSLLELIESAYSFEPLKAELYVRLTGRKKGETNLHENPTVENEKGRESPL